MTTQYDINKDMISLVGSLSDGIHQLQKAVQLIHTEIDNLKSSQNMRNNNFTKSFTFMVQTSLILVACESIII